MSHNEKRLSVTFTALIWSGIALIVCGAAVAVLGIGDDIEIVELTWGSASLKTSQVGLVMIVVGSLLSGTVALRLPSDVRVFDSGRRQVSFMEQVAERAPILFIVVGATASILLVASVFL